VCYDRINLLSCSAISPRYLNVILIFPCCLVREGPRIYEEGYEKVSRMQPYPYKSFLLKRGGGVRRGELCATCGASFSRLRHIGVLESAVKSLTIKFYHDSAPCHTSLAVHQFLANNQIPAITQTPHSPCDFWSFPSLKIGFKGHRFASMEEI
jgi:hypothetical protein